ncbi:DNA excision repair protein ERCC-6-like [Gordionus sp. m RMFG-2023]|uniref:DNA excision repair protein ERCC-6-like n=1 Tax=Gordionus sp. m RMFG-2023 TaxID=3053472 RepID=UPI0031FCBD4F
MGLGKTIQETKTQSFTKDSIMQNKERLEVMDISFIFSKYSRLIGPVLIVCPVTLIHQWLQEFHYWWPFFKISILHQSSSCKEGNRSSKSKWQHLIKNVFVHGGILLTTYSNLVLHREILCQPWYYIFLDEGHKIRNPESQVSKATKMIADHADLDFGARLYESHRFILTGTPMQNDLKELWTLFDFVYPGKLGTLKAFSDNIANPILSGGYASASQIQMATAYKCACVLKDSISPYLLRRTKNNVDFIREINIPNKNEQVLFCQITNYQKSVYQEYLSTFDMDDIIKGRLKIFKALITLRKLCNHPDLVTREYVEKHDDPHEQILSGRKNRTSQYGYWKRSGKMIVLKELLKMWHKQGHKVLIFCQTRQVLDIVEKFVLTKNYTYLRLDGSYSIKSRHEIVNQFNASRDIDPISNTNDDMNVFAFLLTTRVGGVGLNLTSANKVVIFDPDWNPCVDGQAKERSWRIGQTQDVSIYRLLLAGTVEEKIYHRQIFKQYLTNKVLNNPKVNNRIVFKMNDLKQLFTLTEAKNDSSNDLNESNKSNYNLQGGSFFLNRKKLRAANMNITIQNKDDDRTKNMETSTVENGESINFQNNRAKDISEPPPPDDNENARFRKKRRFYAKVDGQEVEFLTKREPYRYDSGDEATKKKSQRKILKEEDDYVLNEILRNSFVTGNISHDSLLRSSTNDNKILGPLVVEEVSDTLTRNAVQKIRESRVTYHATSKYGQAFYRQKAEGIRVTPQKMPVIKQPLLTQEELFYSQLDSRPLKRMSSLPTKSRNIFRDTASTSHDFKVPAATIKIKGSDWSSRNLRNIENDDEPSEGISSAAILKRIAQRHNEAQ